MGVDVIGARTYEQGFGPIINMLLNVLHPSSCHVWSWPYSFRDRASVGAKF